MTLIASINNHPRETIKILKGKPAKGKPITFKRANENPWAANHTGIVKTFCKWGIRVDWT